MGKLLEIEYEKIFKPETMASLKGKSGESLKQMLGNKSLMQTIMRSSELIPEIIEAEKNHITTLEGIAVDMVTQAYPIIDYANIRIDAKIVTMGNIAIPPPSEEEESLPNPEFLEAKRRIINGITQGASIRGAFAFYLFKEYLDLLDDTLVDKYGEILKLSFGIYDSEEAIAMLLAMIAQNKNMPGGESQMEYDEEAQQFVIKARAICFPMLVHEIVKGLYEIVGTQGFGKDKEQNKAVIGAVDKLSNEPRDFQYGKFIYDSLNNLYGESNINDARVRELFFTEVYKLDEEEFVNFIENLINNKLTTIQKQWAMGEMKAIEKDLKKDDTGLAGLDEVKRRKKLAGLIKENNNDFNLKAAKDPNAVFGLFRYSDDERAYFQDVINLLTGRSDFNKKLPNYNLTDLVKKLNDNIKPDELWQALSRAYKRGILPVKSANILFDKIY
jgi:hypothetical protein